MLSTIALRTACCYSLFLLHHGRLFICLCYDHYLFCFSFCFCTIFNKPVLPESTPNIERTYSVGYGLGKKVESLIYFYHFFYCFVQDFCCCNCSSFWLQFFKILKRLYSIPCRAIVFLLAYCIALFFYQLEISIIRLYSAFIIESIRGYVALRDHWHLKNLNNVGYNH